ncbi:MAG TPA: hypothetical protein VFW98_11415 [Gemmatimonadaceae bacterium]|nr:hypothetical protein [Gemmatimonadaceae bacterium]
MPRRTCITHRHANHAPRDDRRSHRSATSVVALSALLLGTASVMLPATAWGQEPTHPQMPGMPMAGPEHSGMAPGPLGIPMSRAGSGTSWVPDASPMHAHHFVAGNWELMLHYLAFGYYDRQNGADAATRGGDQVGSVNWAMLMALRPVGDGRLQLRGMLSAEPWTVGVRGYPLLLQSGEAYRGQPLHDRQHPHDLFMELAALYERPVSRTLGVQLYVAPVGEPASGPVPFPHRPSAADDPFAPLGHHWQDATHISFGVITAGIFSRTWKLEGSLFNGREPDAHRTDFDFRRLDSYAGRLTVNPSANWSLSASYAYLASPEQLHPERSEHRLTASILNERPSGEHGHWSSALLYGANARAADARLSNSVLLETHLDVDGTNAVFGRLEYVNKSSDDLALENALPERHFDIGSAALGYVREIAGIAGVSLGVGGRASLDLVPQSLRPYYGTRTPAGFAVYLRLRPEAMAVSMDTMRMRGHAMPRPRH